MKEPFATLDESLIERLRLRLAGSESNQILVDREVIAEAADTLELIVKMYGTLLRTAAKLSTVSETAPTAAQGCSSSDIRGAMASGALTPVSATPRKTVRERAIEAFIMTCAGPAFDRENVREEAKHIQARTGIYGNETSYVE